MRRRAGHLLCLVLLVQLLPSSASEAASGTRFTRLGSDSSEGNMGADLLYLDVAQRDDNLIVRFGVDQDRALREQSEMSLITWNFSVDNRRIYKINAYLGERRYELLDASDTDSEVCAELVRNLVGSFDRARGVLTLRVPLVLIGIRGAATMGTYNYSECYEGLPDVRSYFRIANERGSYVYSERVDDFLVDREFHTK